MLYSVFGSLAGLIIPVLLVAGAVYFLARSRGNNHEGLTVYDALAAYFYTVIGACMITAAVGMTLFIDVGLKALVGLKESASGDNDEIALASVLVGTGLVVGLLHVIGKRWAQRSSNRTFGGVRRVHLFSMLGIASLAGLVSLPLAINGVVNHYVVERPLYHHGFPSTEAAVAIVVVPLWGYYLYRVIRETARKGNGEDSSASATAASPTE
jgi:hypothetical protein